MQRARVRTPLPGARQRGGRQDLTPRDRGAPAAVAWVLPAMSRTVECPHCGYALRAGRAACPACGSDDATGWRSAEDVDYLSVELPDGYAESDSIEDVSGEGFRRAPLRPATLRR